MYSQTYLVVFIFIFTAKVSFCEEISPCEYDFDINTDLTPEDCEKDGLYYIDRFNPSDCFPRCLERKGINEKCVISQNECAPGLACKKEPPSNRNTCLIDGKTCHSYKYRQDIPKKAWRPDCSLDGTFAPKQCKGESENGRCFCYNAEGKRIFGQAFSDKAKDMTCACSRRRSELEKAGRNDVTLHCDSMGNYDPLQCDSGVCWCADPKTGDVVQSIVPENMMIYLPCYNKTAVGEQYLRKCESQLLAQAKILETLQNHGTMSATLPFIMCDYDGSYGKYRIDKGIAYCTLRDNTNAGTWATQVTAAIDQVDCNCALDSNLFKDNGIAMTFNCEGNGNYQKVQSNTMGEFFCIDSDGFAITEPVKEAIVPENCPTY